ncbi:hypothetical protein [Sphaerotilus mobilis]|nr:hypothetical protein [Sphaerotilus mobilis]
MEKPKVFISVGSNGTEVQRAATDQIFSLVKAIGLSPRQMEKNEWSSEQPLRAIRKVIDECHGVVVVAFTRYEFASGVEYKKNNESSPLQHVRLPTVWNQIEAAMAYGRGLPLLVICEHGLRDDGLLEGKYDWKVLWTDFSTADINSEKFSGFAESWKRLVEEQAAKQSSVPHPKEVDLARVSISKLLGMLTFSQFTSIIAALASAFASVAAVAFKVGGGKWPWE